MKPSNTISAARVREMLKYDPETGEFTWRNPTHNRIKVGQRAGGDNGNGYIQIMLDGVTYKAHRLAWLYVNGEWPDGGLDHRNRDKADNRISNLRPATQSQNMANASRHVDNTSGFKGVTYRKDRRHLPDPWHARIRKDYKQIHIGFYATAKEGGTAYIAAARREFGEYARA